MQSLRGCSLLPRRRSGFCTNWGATVCWTCLLPPMRGLVELWILEFGAKDFDLPGWFFHNPQPKLNNSLELFATALLLLTLNYYHSCSLSMWSCFFMWFLHHEKKKPPSQCGFCRPRNSKPRWWRLTKPAAHLVNVTKLAAVCVNWADACHGLSRISSISLLLPEPGHRTVTVNALYHARQTKEMRWFGFY